MGDGEPRGSLVFAKNNRHTLHPFSPSSSGWGPQALTFSREPPFPFSLHPLDRDLQ